MRDTFRYIRVKFPETRRWYTYRCDFMVREGDKLFVPTCYGDKNVVVMGETSADEEWGFPNAKWAHRFADKRRDLQGWLTNFRVRHKLDPTHVRYANQTKLCLPGEQPSPDHPLCRVQDEVMIGVAMEDAIEPGTPVTVAIDVANMMDFARGGEFKTPVGRLSFPHLNCRSVLMPSSRMGKTATLEMLMKGYGMGDSKMTERLQERKKELEAELAAVDNAIEEAEARVELAEIERTLERQKDAADYRKGFEGVDGVDDKLVDRAIELKARLKYGKDEDEGEEDAAETA